jgi:two-component system sensor kinase FixL
VQLRAEALEGTWRIEVEDAGEGISAPVRERLFQPFSSGRVGGVGLGLSLSRRFVELHGGQLELVTARELGGACFRVSLPRPAPDVPTLGSREGESS